MAEDEVELTLELGDRTVAVLDELVRRGGHGEDRAAVARSLIESAIQRAIAKGLIPRRPDDPWRGRC